MQLRIQGLPRDVAADLRRVIERRVRLALGRHAPGIERTHVALSVIPGPKPEHRCRIRVVFRDGAILAVDDRAADARSAADGAAWRLQQRMQRRWVSMGDGSIPSRRIGLR